MIDINLEHTMTREVESSDAPSPDTNPPDVDYDKAQAFSDWPGRWTRSKRSRVAVVDSTATVADYWLSALDRPVIRDALRVTTLRWAIPEVVRLETVKRYGDERERVRKQASRLLHRSSIDRMNELLPARQEYSASLERRIQATSGTVLPIPATNQADVIIRLMEGKRPFRRGDKGEISETGYKDTVIWLTILQLLQDSPEDVLFISANARDFCDGRIAQVATQKPTLGQDLLDDLVNRGIDSSRIRVFQSWKDLERQELTPQLKTLNEVKCVLESNPRLLSALGDEYSYAHTGLDDSTWEGMAGVYSTGAPPSLFTIYPNETEPLAVDLLAINEVRELHSGEYLVQVHVPLHTTLTVMIRRDALQDFPSVYRYFDASEIYMHESPGTNWEHGACKLMPVDIVVVMEAVLDPTDLRVLAHNFIWYSVEELQAAGQRIACKIPWREGFAPTLGQDQ